jgi:hypothetical protein
VFGGIWHHLHGDRWAGKVSREQMGSEERELTSRSVEDLTAERFVDEQLGGVDHTLGLVGDEPRHH